MTDQADWKRMMFKANKVWLRVDVDEQPLVENTKVLIKYQLDQDYEYWVPEKAVRPIDPEHLKKKVRKKKPRTAAKTHKAIQPSDDTARPGAILVYTDGACSGNPGPAGIGIVLRFGAKEKEISSGIGIATNNVAELMAIKAGLQAIRTTDIPVRLYTDSQYCYGLLVLGWKARRNEALVGAIRKLMKPIKDLEILKIKGHAGIALNERADQLAREAVTKDHQVS